jgi:hypothetical protein
VSEQAPRQVDRYEILSAIGEGGMATVYHARFQAPGGASKQVALKLIHPHLGQEPDFVRMFLNEMRVAMAMSHRNIVQTFDAGKYGDRYYMVMELMNRGSLSGLSGIPLDIAVLVAMEVCAALDYAHAFRQEAVVHRDVSPGNILLSDQGDVKLADFGVAKATGRLTGSTTGLIKGKLSYMAPEQARGKVEPRSDLFALGAVLYWMVTGVQLRPNPSLEQVRTGIERVQFPAEQAEQIPLGLQQVVIRCLRREPEQRPASAAELRELLARELEIVQLKMGTDGDLHARLRGFLAPRAPTGVDPEPDGQARRLAAAVMQMALAVPTHHSPLEVEPAEPPTTAAPETTEVGPAVAPVAVEQVGTAEIPVIPARRPRRWPLGVAAGGLALVVGALAWWLWPAPPDTDPAPIPLRVLVSAEPDIGPAAELPADAFIAEPKEDADTAAEPEASAARPRRPVPRGHGQLDLNSSPWAKVYVDGRYVGETPLQGVRLRAGRHKVRLVNPERRFSTRLTVQIRTGRTTRRWIRLGGPLPP